MPGSIVNAMPGVERATRDADVVHVHADPVRDAVRRPDLELRAAPDR